MGIDLTMCVELRLNGVWTFFGCCDIRRDPILFEQLGLTDSCDPGCDDSHWSAVTRYHHRQSGGFGRGEITLEVFRTLAERRRRERPDRFDLRPGCVSEFQEWVESEIASDHAGHVQYLLTNWPLPLDEGLGNELRVCYWFT